MTKKTKAKTTKTIEVQPVLIYYKTGDDFEGWLQESGGDVSLAYSKWADSLEKGVAYLRRMATELKGTDSTGGGGANCIFLQVPEPVGKRLLAEKLVEPGHEEDNCGGNE